MAMYDLVIVGGGIGGSALARSMAERSHRVLVIDRETRFSDRVRGELVFPWGVAEAKALGIYDVLLQDAGAHHPTYWAEYAGPDPSALRDFAEDTPQKLRALCVYHPRMQEALLHAAASAGAEIRRGARVCLVEPGGEPRVVIEQDGRRSTVSGRLVVGADGRSSSVRTWGGFASRDDPPGNRFTGVLLENVPAPPERSVCMINPFAQRMALYLPQTAGSGRAYLASPSSQGLRLSGRGDFQRFLQECSESGLAAGLLDGARQAGPLATFEGADSWVEHPYRDGIALLGDAAATSDPTWGQGLSLTWRDVRVLGEALLAGDDWDAAGHAYAHTHDGYYQQVRTTNAWFTQIFLQPGPVGDALRAHVLPQLEHDPLLLPDTQVAGPDLAPPTGQHREKIFGRILDVAQGGP